MGRFRNANRGRPRIAVDGASAQSASRLDRGPAFPARRRSESPERAEASAAAPSGFLFGNRAARRAVSISPPRSGGAPDGGGGAVHKSFPLRALPNTSPRKQFSNPACAPAHDALPFRARRWGNPQTYRTGGKLPVRTRPSSAVYRKRGSPEAHRLRSAGFRTDRTGRTGILRDRRASGSVAGFRACCSWKRERGFRAAPAVGFG